VSDPPIGVVASGNAVEQTAIARNARAVRVVWLREILRLRRMRLRIAGGFVQPLLFLIVLGGGLKNHVSSQTLPGGVSYQAYIFPGVIAMAIIISAITSSVAIVWDREFGFMRELLVAPVARISLVFGKAAGGSSVATAQGLVLMVLAPVFAIHLSVARLLEASLALLLLAFAMTAIGIVAASRVRRLESFQVILALVMQPMIFLSGALFPLENLPGWLAVLCRLNPATYGVDMVRRAMLGSAQALTIGSWTVPVWFDLAVVISTGIAMLLVAARLFAVTD
jgi:ABC-2 type transport system permease protein